MISYLYTQDGIVRENGWPTQPGQHEWPNHGLREPTEVVATPIKDPMSPEFLTFHDRLIADLGEEQVETLPFLQQELVDPRFIFVAVTDTPAATDEHPMLVSGTYGSLVSLANNEAMLAVKFAHTDKEHRGSGVTPVAYARIIEEAKHMAEERQMKLTAICGEAVETSERAINRVTIIDGHPRCRMYIEQSDGSYIEMRYALSPLEWNRDGSPASDPIGEHFMMAWIGDSKYIPAHIVKHALECLSEEWYVRPHEDFESFSAWQSHYRYIKNHRKEVLFKQFEGVERVVLLSHRERENLRAQGITVTDFDPQSIG